MHGTMVLQGLVFECKQNLDPRQVYRQRRVYKRALSHVTTRHINTDDTNVFIVRI